MNKTFCRNKAVVIASGLVSAMFVSSVVAAEDGMSNSTENPLKGMTAVEASKGLELPTGSDNSEVAQGRYLVGLLGCASCHTDGALIGKPDPNKTLAGSSIGIAYSNPMVNNYPGAVYPPNLTPDKETGLGEWSLEEVVTLLRSGKTRHGRQTMAIMPWTSYAQLSESDATAIASYLLSLEPIKNRVPEQVRPGTPARTPLVHVGLYRSR
ncbi:c-type cytochrome [Congregibacter sp.]|uniref:c-type cytochrome n=1 Tax=Congregibacter sp. TaxID=2744308 RepID=UPI003F6BA6D7